MNKNILTIVIVNIIINLIFADYLLKHPVEKDIIDNMIVGESQSTSLYEFSSHTFTNCGQEGKIGPTLTMCQSSYNTTWDENNEFFNMDKQGYQVWTVPRDGIYEIKVYGAAGGANPLSNNYGFGAYVKTDINLSKSDKIGIAVGQRGGYNNVTGGGGGGGGTFVWPINTVSGWNSGLPIAAAGGGAGAAYYSYTTNSHNHGKATYNGTSSGYYEAPYRSDAGGSGGSWNSYQNSNNSGKSWLAGLIGGSIITSGGPEGGFGGGASASTNNYAGGGGFSGGAESGPNNSYPDTSVGSGGGSIVNYGSNIIKTAGYNNGHGYVVITLKD